LIRSVRYLYLKTGHSVRKTTHYHMRVSGSDGLAFQAEVKLQQPDRTVPRLSEKKLSVTKITCTEYMMMMMIRTCVERSAILATMYLRVMKPRNVFGVPYSGPNTQLGTSRERKTEGTTYHHGTNFVIKASSKLLQSQFRLQYLLPLVVFGSRVLEYAGIWAGPGREGVVGSHSSRAGRSGVGNPVGTRDFHLSISEKTGGPEAHPGSCTLGTVAL